MRLLIADDHALTRAGIRYALEERKDFTVVGEADSGPKVLPLVGQTSPDVILLDTDMPGLDGLTCLERLGARHPEVAVIMLAAEASPARLQAAFARGARGWILKTIDPQELGPAIVRALDATVFVPYGPVHDDSAVARTAGLSGREVDIIRLLGRGYSNKEIATELWITVQTVKFHLTNIYRKLGLSNRTATARWAHENGLLLTET
jgi:DNA-binding NarL/FixJ family response regulator